MNAISFHDTHLYPGCLVTISAIPPGVTPVVAEFSDGSRATAESERLGPDEILVRIDAYTTARRTWIPAKSWRLTYNNDHDLRKVVAKV